jgi:hypothetical protein
MKHGHEFAIAFSLAASLLVNGAARAQWPLTTRVSVDSSGAQANAQSAFPSLSADGSFVAFYSLASNLVAGDTNATYDVFVRDRTSGATERVSVATGGAEGNYVSGYPSISADGRFVAFQSGASNLVAGDTNGLGDVFVRDLISATTERVSVGSAGAQGDNDSFVSTLSADGRFVAFYGSASNFVAGDTNSCRDSFVRDRNSAATERVSVDSLGAQGNASSTYASLSADGRFVAFVSVASNLVPGDTNGCDDIFVRDRTGGTIERVSVLTGGAQVDNSSSYPSISADGRFVAFYSSATNLVPGDTNGCDDVFVHDRQSATTERVSVDSSGAQADGPSGDFGLAISGDGRYVAFSSGATVLVPGDTNGATDIFVHDRTSGTTERVSVDSGGAQANAFSRNPSISADGRCVGFASLASNLVAGDTNGDFDVFVRERWQPWPTMYCTAGTTTHGCSAGIAANMNPSISFANPCDITITSVEGLKTGILFYGIDNTGFAPGPWAIGSTSLLCVKQPTQRTPIQNSGGTFGACDGSYLLDWNAYQTAHPFALGNPWSVGGKAYAQAWFRDPPAVKATNLSNALELTYFP